MVKQLLLIILIGFSSILKMSAQIYGVVVDAGTGEPIPYLNVYYDGKGVGTITDNDGRYKISYHPGWTKLTFSMVGYETQEIIVSAKTATADAILSYIRARKNSQGSANVETLYQLVDDKVEALEFIIKSETRYTGIPFKDLAIKSNNLIACIARKRQIIIPGGDDCIEVGDSVIVITMEKHIEDIEDILA